MTRIIRLVQNYLLFALPFVVVSMVWSTFNPAGHVSGDATALTKFLWEVFSWNLMVWFAVLTMYLVALAAVPAVREKTVTRLANVKERDEREEYITGKAARATYISTLGVLILLLFLSIFSLDIHRVADNQALDGKNKTLNISAHFQLLDQGKIEKNSVGEVLFDSTGVSLSKSAIVLSLLIWQLLVFNFTARKEQVVGS